MKADSPQRGPCSTRARAYLRKVQQRTILSAVLLLAACSKQAQSPAPEPSTTAATTSGDSVATGAAMWHHFWDVAVARDAVIQGNLADARRPLLRIANGKVEEDLPRDWMPWIEEMRDEARKASEAKTLRDMANVVTAVSGQCAECHRTTRGGPVVKVDSLDYGHPKDRGLHGVMERHAWAADELWVGMTVPSSPSWARGALALADFPVPGMEDANSADGGAASRAGEASADIDPAMIPQLEAVRALGKRAEAAGQPFEQTAVFSELITLCGDCHNSLPKNAPPSPELAR